MKNSNTSLHFLSAAFLVVFLASCKQDSGTLVNPPVGSGNPGGNQPGVSPIPKTPGTIVSPANNPVDDPKFAARVELGRHLFYDPAFAVDGSTSCASCHSPGAGFSDPRSNEATSMGFQNRMGTRNAPALANIGYYIAITWDGKFKTLEDHALAPIFNNIEMGNNFSATGNDPITTGYYHSDPGANDTLFLFARLDGSNTRNHGLTDQNSTKRDKNGNNYYALLNNAWGTSTFSLDLIQKSIACFERTFVSTQSTFDRYNKGDVSVFKYNPEAIHGFQLFTDTAKANCIGCHNGYNFTDQKFHNNGLYTMASPITQKYDSGRVGISKDPADAFKFRTPGLRNVALSAPYMHDGRKTTLADVLDFYNRGGDPGVTNKDSKIKKLNLTDQDMSDIIEFLKTLSDPQFTSNGAYANPWR